MSKIIVTCPRCNGSGHFSFNLVRGTVCFGCEGSGKVATTEAKIAASKARAKKSAETAIKRNENIVAYQGELIAKYENDARLGTAIRARMAKFEGVYWETIFMLRDIDGGKKIHPTVIESLLNNEAITLNVKYAEKEIARALGAKWNATVRSWEWPESTLALPEELKKYI